jgi:hypothetical protein
MKRFVIAFLFLGAALCFAACEEEGSGPSVVVEKVDGYKPNLPPIPSIPRPDVPETFGDGSFSIYGLRKNTNKTMDTQVTVTAFIASAYEKPACAEGQTCHTLMPHVFLADKKDETVDRHLVKLVGFASSFKEMETERENAEAGKQKDLPEGVFLAPVVWDWRVGHKYKITGRFSRESGAGFKDADGLIEYDKHECLDCPVEEEKPKR